MAEEKAAGTAQQGGDQPTRLKVGEKEYGPEDINNLVQTASSSSRSLEEVKPVVDMCRQYGITPEVLAQQANSAFSIISELISQGLIDEEGKIQTPKQGGEEPPSERQPMERQQQSNQRTDEIAGAALNPVLAKLEAIEKQVQAIDAAQANMIRQDIKGKLKGTFPNLEEEDIEVVIGQSVSQRGANLFELAKARSEGKASKTETLKQALAKEWGVDLTKINEQKTLDAPGGAASLYEGRKFSLEKKGKDSVTPKQAALDYLKRVSSEV